MMFIVSLVEFSKRVQNEISAKVMPKPQIFAVDSVDRIVAVVEDWNGTSWNTVASPNPIPLATSAV
jgi:hypothetical protein